VAYKKSIDAESRGKIGEAIKRLEDAVKIASGFFQAHNALGVAYGGPAGSRKRK